MIKNALRAICATFFSLVICSCEKNTQSDLKFNIKDPISIREAKSAFLKITQELGPSTDSLAPNAAYNIPDWESAKWKIPNRGIAFLEVPLKSAEKIIRKRLFYNGTKQQEVVVLPDPWLMVFRDSSKKLVFSVVQQTPRKNLADTSMTISPHHFSGDLKVYDWAGKLRYGTQYKNGFPIKRLGVVQARNPNARWDVECYTKYKCVYTAMCGGLIQGTYYAIQLAAEVETTDAGGCSGTGPGASPYSELNMQNPSYNAMTCDGSWQYYNSSSEVACDYYWIDDNTNPDPEPTDPDYNPDYIYYYLMPSAPPGKTVNITDFLKCFSLTTGAKFTIYADQPISGTRIPIDLSGAQSDVGHSFVTIEQTVGGSTVKRTFGFYPSIPVDIYNSTVARAIVDDATHPYDVSLSTNVTAAQLQSIIYAATHAPNTYDLVNYNCTDFAIKLATEAGLTLPSTHNVSFPGCNPADLGQDMRSKTGAITTAGTAPANSGTCN